HTSVQVITLKEKAYKKEIKVLHYPIGLMLANGLTKALPVKKFVVFRNQIGVKSYKERIKERKVKEMIALEIEELKDLFTGGEVEILPRDNQMDQ
ncbi:hypothetical protein QBC44DRAFT_254137, partial [Cladorrhinum sp. PSN332]